MTNETDLTDEQFAIVERFADEPLPEPVYPTENEINQIIGSLAAHLKDRPSPIDHGRLNRAMFLEMLSDVPLAALRYAARRAANELEWMPVAATLKKLAKDYNRPEWFARNKAQRLKRERRQRIFVERCFKVSNRSYPEEELANLPDQVKRYGIHNRHLIELNDGSIRYWTLQLWKDDQANRKAEWEKIRDEAKGADASVERDKRAQDSEGDRP